VRKGFFADPGYEVLYFVIVFGVRVIRE
jgi:hypothetical protein